MKKLTAILLCILCIFSSVAVTASAEDGIIEKLSSIIGLESDDNIGYGIIYDSNKTASGVTGITGTLGTIYQHSLVPHTLRGNTNGGDVLTADGSNTFFYNRKSIKAETAQKIDEYFDMFGYKTNMVKVPNSNHRSRWWYTKTIDVNIDGNIDNIDLQKIKDCYNKGITFWRNASEIENYSLSNPII